jgi:hypothetical protein
MPNSKFPQAISQQVLLMDNPSSVLIDIHSLESTPVDHDRNLTNKVEFFNFFVDCLTQIFMALLITSSSECHFEDFVQAQVIHERLHFSLHSHPFSLPLFLISFFCSDKEAIDYVKEKAAEGNIAKKGILVTERSRLPFWST